MLKVNYYVYLFGEAHPIVCFREATGATTQYIVKTVCQRVREHGQVRGIDGLRITHTIQVGYHHSLANDQRNYIFDALATDTDREEHERSLCAVLDSVIGEAKVQQAMKDQAICS